MGACERCSRLKEKCSFDGADRACCRRCRAVGSRCIARKRKRMGRPPAVSRAADGLFSIFVTSKGVSDIVTSDNGSGSGSDTASPKGEIERDGNPAAGRHSELVPYSRPQMIARVSKGAKHALIKRRPEAATVVLPSISNTRIPRGPCDLKLLAPRYAEIRYFIESSDGFFSIHRHFMLGGSFLSQFQRAVRLTLEHSPRVMADGYAAAISLLRLRRGFLADVTHDSDTRVELAARCVQHLNNLGSSIKQAQSAAVVAMLGQLMMVYSSMMPMSGSGTITRGTLWAIKPWFPALMSEPDMESICLPPLCVDTIDCLLKRELPVIRMPETRRNIVDRFVGFAAPLLTMMYDLCVCSHRAKSERRDASLLCQDEDYYLDIEHRISRWEPQQPSDIDSIVSPAEQLVLLTHARLYRLASLLIIHRLRHPIGVQDEYAHGLADGILEDLEMLVASISCDGATGLGLDFPLLVAMVERPERGEALHVAYDPMRYRLTQFSRETVQFVKLVRATCDSGFRGLWLDLVPGGLPGGFMP